MCNPPLCVFNREDSKDLKRHNHKMEGSHVPFELWGELPGKAAWQGTSLLDCCWAKIESVKSLKLGSYYQHWITLIHAVVLKGNYFDALVASKYITRQTTFEIVEQKDSQSKRTCSNHVVYWINLKHTGRSKEKREGVRIGTILTKSWGPWNSYVLPLSLLQQAALLWCGHEDQSWGSSNTLTEPSPEPTHCPKDPHCSLLLWTPPLDLPKPIIGNI